MTTADAIDSVISAELPPDPSTLPAEQQEQARRLEAIVLTNMVHGPCGEANPNAACMRDGACSKWFPKKFSCTTIVDTEVHHPVYKRRSPAQGGRSITIMRGGREFVVDNSLIVPYSPYLSLRYNCHINVELCTDVGGVKYLLNYVHKGCDMTMAKSVVEGEERNEIEEYRNLRSVGSSEAAWHTFGFHISRNYPAVKPLRIHLENQQMVVFDEGSEEAAAESPRDTELMAFFDYNKKQKEAGSSEDFLRYVDFPEEFIYEQKTKSWRPRVRETETIGRVHSVSPASGDVFYLRMLLHNDHCRGKTSFLDLRTMPGEEEALETYKEVCRRLGLLQDDQEWDEALTEAEYTGLCPAIRELYVTILLFCEPSNPRQLFDNHWLQWSEDFQHRARVNRREELDQDQLRTLVLVDIEQRLQSWEKSLDQYGLPTPTEDELQQVEQEVELRLPALIREELDFDWQEMSELANTRRGQYTPEQLEIYNTVMDRISSNHPLVMFINARGGCGKTFLLNGILAAVRSGEPGGCVALAMATTGIAANLLMLGRTFHSRMKAPLTPSDEGVFNITSQSVLADLIRKAKVLLIDESTVLDKSQLQMMDRTLQDLTGMEEPFGNKVVLLSGDFR